MDPGHFKYAYPYQYDPWTSGSLSRPGPLDERNYWWRGIQYVRFTDPFNRVTLRQVWLPLWLIASALLFLPVVRTLIGFRSWRRSRKGCCPFCGYNLTGNTSGACPECGAQIDNAGAME
jgi:hypothetical protein